MQLCRRETCEKEKLKNSEYCFEHYKDCAEVRRYQLEMGRTGEAGFNTLSMRMHRYVQGFGGPDLLLPAALPARDGDYYFDVSNGDIHRYIDEVWQLIYSYAYNGLSTISIGEAPTGMDPGKGE